MRVALYNCNVVRGDATGNALLAKVAACAIAQMERHVFTQWSNVSAPEISVVSGIDEVRRSPLHRDADVHVFEFGWHYDLFEMLPDVARRAGTVVSFHGVTPRELVPPANRGGIDRTVDQLQHAKHADIVLGASEYARRFLERHCISASRIRIVPLPLRLPRVARAEPTPGCVRLLFVGRMVPSKGALDLLTALTALRDDGHAGWHLDLVTNAVASDAEYISLVRDRIREAQLEPWVDYHDAIEGRAELSAFYAAADAVIIPTYSDTYCLPLLEGLASGCAVIAYASGAVPEVATGLARLVPTGDVQALTAELAQLFGRASAGEVAIGDNSVISREAFARRAGERTRDLDGAAYDRTFLDIIRDVAKRPRRWSWLPRRLRG